MKLYQVFLERDPTYLFASDEIGLCRKDQSGAKIMWDPIDVNPELWISYKHMEKEIYVYAIQMKENFLIQQDMIESIGRIGDFIVIDVFKKVHIVQASLFYQNFHLYIQNKGKVYTPKLVSLY